MYSAVTAHRFEVYNHLMACSRGMQNDGALAYMLATRSCGGGALPGHLGLQAHEFARLLNRHFPGAQLPDTESSAVTPRDPRLLEEQGELIRLLLMYRAGIDESESWMATVVATGCMASDHLWQDLGLWSRRDLSELMARNFPRLAALNNRDMKWKKFLYKQLCIQEGIYICRAPSCELCADYNKCFGPE